MKRKLIFDDEHKKSSWEEEVIRSGLGLGKECEPKVSMIDCNEIVEDETN